MLVVADLLAQSLYLFFGVFRGRHRPKIIKKSRTDSRLGCPAKHSEAQKRKYNNVRAISYIRLSFALAGQPEPAVST
jgi:hypothetical protein